MISPFVVSCRSLPRGVGRGGGRLLNLLPGAGFVRVWRCGVECYLGAIERVNQVRPMSLRIFHVSNGAFVQPFQRIEKAWGLCNQSGIGQWFGIASRHGGDSASGPARRTDFVYLAVLVAVDCKYALVGPWAGCVRFHAVRLSMPRGQAREASQSPLGARLVFVLGVESSKRVKRRAIVSPRLSPFFHALQPVRR